MPEIGDIEKKTYFAWYPQRFNGEWIWFRRFEASFQYLWVKIWIDGGFYGGHVPCLVAEWIELPVPKWKETYSEPDLDKAEDEMLGIAE